MGKKSRFNMLEIEENKRRNTDPSAPKEGRPVQERAEKASVVVEQEDFELNLQKHQLKLKKKEIKQEKKKIAFKIKEMEIAAYRKIAFGCFLTVSAAFYFLEGYTYAGFENVSSKQILTVIVVVILFVIFSFKNKGKRK